MDFQLRRTNSGKKITSFCRGGLQTMEDENRRTVRLLIDLFVNIKNELVSTNVNKNKYNYMHIATYLFILTPLLPIIVVAAAACHRRCQPADPQ